MHLAKANLSSCQCHSFSIPLVSDLLDWKYLRLATLSPFQQVSRVLRATHALLVLQLLCCAVNLFPEDCIVSFQNNLGTVDTSTIVTPIQQLIPAAPEPELQPEVTPSVISPQEPEVETLKRPDVQSAEETQKSSEEKTEYGGSQSETVTQSDAKSNPESETQDNVIMIKTTEDQSEETSATSGLSETVIQSEPSTEPVATTEPVASPSETPVTAPASEPVEEISRD